MTTPATAAPPAAASFSITGCVGESWRAFWRDPWLGFSIFLAFVAQSLVRLVPFLGRALTFLFAPAVLGGAASLSIRMVERRSPRLEDLLLGFRRWWRFFLASLLLGVILLAVALPVVWPVVLLAIFHERLAVPLIALTVVMALVCIPAVVFLDIRLSFITYLIADSPTVGVLDAYRHSWAITRGRFWRLLWLVVLLLLVQIAGFACLLVGLLVTVPMLVLGYAAAYSRLRPADLMPHPAATAPTMTPAASVPPAAPAL